MNLLLQDHLDLQKYEPVNHNYKINLKQLLSFLTDEATMMAGIVQKSEYQVPQQRQRKVRIIDRVK